MFEPETAAWAIPRGRDILVDGPGEPVAIGRLFAAALGLPSWAVTTAGSSEAELQAAWAADGRIAVHALGPGGDVRFKLDVDLVRAPIAVTLFLALARRHGLTIAWCMDEAAPEDWSYRVAFPDGSVALRRIAWLDAGDCSACVMSDPNDSAERR